MCSKQDDTVVLAHRNMPGDFGTGIKGFDWHSGYLCFDCHRYGDGEGRKDSEFWELACYRTMTRFIAQGLVKIE
jgi:hypothetical protein